MAYKYGLKPVHYQPRVRLCDYYTSDLPSVDSLPNKFGHADLIKPMMFLNDRIGCCAEAGSQEEVRLLNALRGVTVNFNDAATVANYHEITGYIPGPELVDPQNAPPNPTDQGTDVHELYDFRRSTGLVDADGNRHKIVAYAGLTPGDWDELLIALSLFQVVGLGIRVPDYAQDQFEQGGPWTLRPQSVTTIVGVHYIPAAGRDGDAVPIYTWGGKIDLARDFYAALNTVAVVSLTQEMFTADELPVDFQKLAHDLPELNTGPVM